MQGTFFSDVSLYFYLACAASMAEFIDLEHRARRANLVTYGWTTKTFLR